jgi:hypothetical protein
MSLTANASDSPHPKNCRCTLCRVYRTSKAFDQAALLYEDLLKCSGPEQANAPYRPAGQKPLLILHQVVIGLDAATSTYIYKWSIPGIGEGKFNFIEVPAILYQDELF